jgi:hypothetical protein
MYACDGQGVSCGQAPDQPVNRSETGLGPNPFYNLQQPGADFVKAGVTTRRHGMTVPQPEPFVLTVPAVPAGAVVVETFMSWNYLSNSAPANDIVTVNGVPITGAQQGLGSPDLCWAKTYAVNYLASGLTSTVNPGPAPVNVTIAGATDKALGADANVYGEGLTILVVYYMPDEPWRNLDLYKGYTSTETTGTGAALATLNFTVTYLTPDFHFFLNALDGQVAGDDFFIDGVNRSGQVLGTGVVGDAWQGFLGPNAASNYYDHANDDISSFFLPPKSSITVSTVQVGSTMDCVGHSFGGVSFPMEAPSLSSLVDILPDPMYVYDSYIIDPPPGYAYVGNLSGGYTVNQINPASVLINGSVVPTSTAILPSYPGFTGPVLELTFVLRQFVPPYEPVWDQQTVNYTITGQIMGGPPFSGTGSLQMIGHLTGDADGNHVINISDALYIAAFIFENGPEPYVYEVGDVDCNGLINVSDVVYLIAYIFDAGPEPCKH